MNNLTTKQKIILAIVACIMLSIIGIYGYTTLHNEDDFVDLEYNEIADNTELASNSEIEEKNQLIENSQSIENDESMQSDEKQIIVHITGAVQKVGILKLPEGARIADAIDAADGITEDADLDEVNLAYILEDGQKIYIPSKADKKENKEYITSGSGNNVIEESKSTSQGVNKKVNINTATQSDLEALPGIGPSIASRIIEYRQQNGKFNKIEDLQNVKGIGDAKFENIKEYVVVN